MAESNPAVTGPGSSMSCAGPRIAVPGIGTVRNESAAEVTARYRHGAALSLLHCDSSQLRVMAGTGFYENGADLVAGFDPEASRGRRLGRRAPDFDRCARCCASG